MKCNECKHCGSEYWRKTGQDGYLHGDYMLFCCHPSIDPKKARVDFQSNDPATPDWCSLNNEAKND